MSSEELRNDMLYHAALSIAAEMLANPKCLRTA